MQFLSQELLLRIIGNVTSSDDLKSLRFVNKRTSILVTEALFHTIYVRSQEASLIKLMAISKHSLLSELVTTIIYEADANFQEYRNPQGVAGRPWWNANTEQQLDHQQIHALLLDEASRLACSVFDLPNVKSLRFAKLSPLGFDHSDPSIAELLTATVPDLPEELCGYGVQSFMTLMRAASVAASRIRTLETSNRLHGLHYSFLYLGGVDMHHIVSVFANLTSISLYLNTNEGERGSEDALRGGNLSNLLMTSTHLQKLSLGFDQRPDARVSLTCILGSGEWKALRRLDVMAIDFHLWEMTSFFLRHPDINHVGLANCRLHSGDLRQLLALLKDGLSLLKTVSLDGALGDSTTEFDFLEYSENRRTGTDFVLGIGNYPTFTTAEPEEE